MQKKPKDLLNNINSFIIRLVKFETIYGEHILWKGRKMKFEFDDFNYKDQVEFMNLNKQMQQNQVENNQGIGFNNDMLYDFAERNNF